MPRRSPPPRLVKFSMTKRSSTITARDLGTFLGLRLSCSVSQTIEWGEPFFSWDGGNSPGSAARCCVQAVNPPFWKVSVDRFHSRPPGGRTGEAVVEPEVFWTHRAAEALRADSTGIEEPGLRLGFVARPPGVSTGAMRAWLRLS